MIHFIYVILETDAYYYSAYLDALDALHGCFPSPETHVTISLFWDGEKNKESILQRFGARPYEKRKILKSMDLSTRISTFVNQSRQEVPAELHVLGMYMHGNIWFMRHSGKILPFGDLFSKITDVYDILCLESCSSATLENCLELRQKARYLVTSEGPHSKCTMLHSHCVNVLRQTPTSQVAVQALAIFLARCFIHKVNSYSYRDRELLELGCDISVIDLRAFETYQSFLLSLGLNQQPERVYQQSKVYPKLRNTDLGYDVYSVVERGTMSLQIKQEFAAIFSQIVVYYEQSTPYQEKKYAGRSHGLSWSPAPYDGEFGWTYKLTEAFRYQDQLTIYE